MNFSEVLRELRKEKKKTQKDIAKYLGLTRQAIAYYELGKRKPDYDTLKKLADYFSVSIDYLLGRAESSHNDGLNMLEQNIEKKCEKCSVCDKNIIIASYLFEFMDNDLLEWIMDKSHIEYIEAAKQLCDTGLPADVLKAFVKSISQNIRSRARST